MMKDVCKKFKKISHFRIITVASFEISNPDSLGLKVKFYEFYLFIFLESGGGLIFRDARSSRCPDAEPPGAGDAHQPLSAQQLI